MSYRPPSSAGAVTGTTSTRDDDWRDRAACLGEDPELFFAIGNQGPALQQIEEAKAVCARCEVTGTCLRWALDTGADDGVWGGKSEDERRALKRSNTRKSRAASPKPAEAKAPTKTEAKRDPVTRPECGRQRGYETHTRKGERQCDTCRAWRIRGKRIEAA